MPFQIVRNDITKMRVDAIVNAANSSLLGGGGVDGAIHRAAGPELLQECRAIRAREGGCPTGQAKITGAGRLSCRYVIHTVGPVWQGGGQGEEQLLFACYQNSLSLAAQRGCDTVAFPLISAGAYGYPREQALQVAEKAIRAFLQSAGPDEMTVYLVVFDKAAFAISSSLYKEVAAYIDGHCARPPGTAQPSKTAKGGRRPALQKRFGQPQQAFEGSEEAFSPAPAAMPLAAVPASLDEALQCLDESFSEMLLRKIDERGITDAACYKKANISRKLFSKIRSDRLYKPSKPTALAFALALELPLDETRELLMKAGYALSHSSKFDVIVEYFIQSGNYDVLTVNEALFAFDQALLGSA